MSLPSDKFDQRPYVDLIETIGPIRVFSVDGNWIRKHIQREFTNFASPLHPLFKGKIPPNEFWFADGIKLGEYPIFLDHVLVEYWLQSRGLPFAKAEKAAMKVEARERGLFGADEKKEIPPGIEPRIRIIGRAEDKDGKKYTAILVNSTLVRSFIPRFCSGGNGAVYPALPENEVWVDDDLKPPAEWDFNGLHELEEADRMFPMIAKGIDRKEAYQKAHPIASRIEYEARWDKAKLAELLKKWKIVNERVLVRQG